MATPSAHPLPGSSPPPTDPPFDGPGPFGEPPPSPGWPAWAAPLALLSALAVAFLGAIVIAIVGGVDGDAPPGAILAGTVVQDAGLIGAALLFAGMTAPPTAAQFGLRPVRWWPASGRLLGAWATFVAFSLVWVSALGIDEKDDLPDELGVDESALALGGALVLVCLIAPIAEELFFRGFFFTALRGWRGPWVAAALTGVVFGGIHAGGSPVGFLVPLMAFGFVLCVLYWRTGSLLPAIALHCLNNSLAFGVQQEWEAWQVVALMVGANLAIGLVLTPFVRRAAPASQ